MLRYNPHVEIVPQKKVLKVRVRDKHAKVLCAMATETNQVWNYCNELSERMARERGKWMSGFDFSPYTVGASKEFEHIGSSTIQEVAEQFAVKRRAARRVRLRWRKSFGERRSLGWVPFKARAAKWKHGQVVFAGRHFNVWDSYGLSGFEFKAGCFCEDARGRWYFCATVIVEPTPNEGRDWIGIDLGLKTAATCSDGTVLESREYRDIEGMLAIAQRARKKARTRALHAKARNRREDAQHKFTRALVDRCAAIYVGNVSPTKLMKTNMAKSVNDVGWASLKTKLRYKARQGGIVYSEVHEAYTTVSCSGCASASGPRGLKGLRMREWECGACGERHDRDVNAARNILTLGRGHAPPVEGILCL